RAQVKRLADEALRTTLYRFVPCIELAAEHDHRDRADTVPLLHTSQHLPAVDLRHHHVEQDQVRRLILECGQPVLRVRRLADGIALHLEVDPHDFADLRVVVDEQHERAARRLSGPRTLEEGLEVTALVPAMPAGGVEGRDAADVGPFPDRALRDAQELRRLAERQPVALAGSSPPWTWVSRRHTANLPKRAPS